MGHKFQEQKQSLPCILASCSSSSPLFTSLGNDTKSAVFFTMSIMREHMWPIAWVREWKEVSCIFVREVTKNDHSLKWFYYYFIKRRKKAAEVLECTPFNLRGAESCSSRIWYKVCLYPVLNMSAFYWTCFKQNGQENFIWEKGKTLFG